MPIKSVLTILIGTGLILLVPLVAMQFTDEVVWGAGDFAAAGALLSATGILYVIVSRQTDRTTYRAALAAILALVLLTVWAHLAVGLF